MKLTPCELTAAQEKAWEQTRCALLFHCPAFTHIFYEMMNNAGSKHIALFTKDIPIAATDGSNLILNPDEFFKMDLQERVFVCAHEILHCVFDHCGHGFRARMGGSVKYADGSKLPYDPQTANVAMDLVINDCLIDSRVGKFPTKGVHDKSLGTANDAWVDVYKKIFKKQHPQGGFDQHLDPGTSQGKDPGSANQQRNQGQWNQAVAAGAAAAKAMGKLPAGLERLLADVQEPQVDWREKIRSLFMRRLGADAYDWRRPDRRLISRKTDPIYAPARSGYGAGTVVVGVDTSGSIGPKELDMFFSEIAGILTDVVPKEVVIMWCDAQVHRVDYCDEVGDLNTVRCKGAPGGGGTSFVPVFDRIAELGIEPDALVYLTDGMGSFPGQAPSFPVIWGNIYEGSKYPWGDVVDVPKQA